MRNAACLTLFAALLPLGGCGDLPAASAADRLAALDHGRYAVQSLHGVVVTQTDALAAPTSVQVLGDQLVVLDAFADHSIHVVRRGDGVLERSIGPRGRGPGEFEYAASIDPVPGSDGAFWVYDVTLRRSTLVDLEADFEEGHRVGDEILLINTDVLVLDPVRIGDGLLGLGFFQAGRIGHLDDDGRLVSTSGQTPLPGLDIPASTRQHAYQSRMEPNPSRTRLAVATRHADALEIYDARGRRVALGERPFDFEPAFEVQEKAGRPALASGDALRFGYVDLATTDDRIFALFSGQTRAAADPSRANFGSFVHVYDWSGRLQQVLELETPAIAIGVTADGGTLYAVQHDPVPAVVEYALSRAVEQRLALAE